MAVLLMPLRLLTQEENKRGGNEKWLYLNHMKEELIKLMEY